MPELKREITKEIAEKYPEWFRVSIFNSAVILCVSCHESGSHHIDNKSGKDKICAVPDLIHYREKCERMEKILDQVKHMADGNLQTGEYQKGWDDCADKISDGIDEALADLKDEAKEGV